MAKQALKNIDSFFDENYQTPTWLAHKFSRRKLLKSAAGMTAIAALPAVALTKNEQQQLSTALRTDPWLTLDAVLEHLCLHSFVHKKYSMRISQTIKTISLFVHSYEAHVRENEWLLVSLSVQ